MCAVSNRLKGSKIVCVYYNKSFIMQNLTQQIKDCIYCNNDVKLRDLLACGVNPNLENGWPIRLAARYGRYVLVNALIQYGANPHLLGEAGASTLQLAVFSGQHWDTDNWNLLLSLSSPSQLADGAAVAIIFSNVAALSTILATRRCNIKVPTSLTGKTLEDLAKAYKLHHKLYSIIATPTTVDINITPNNSPGPSRVNRQEQQRHLTPQQGNRDLSPSVAQFFYQSSTMPALTPPRNIVSHDYSPTGRG